MEVYYWNPRGWVSRALSTRSELLRPQCAEACVAASKCQHEALGIQLKLEIEIEMKKTVPVQLSLISPLRSLNLVCFQKLRCPTSLVPLWMMMRNP